MPDRLSDFMRALSARPEHVWPDAVIHHAFRVALLLGLAFLLHVLFPGAPAPDFPQYERGNVPQEDLIAQEAFAIPKSPAQLTQERDEAAAAVAPVFRYDPTAVDTVLHRVREFMSHIDSAAAVGENDTERRESVRRLLMTYGFVVNPAAVDLLLEPANRRTLLRSLERTMEEELPLGIVSDNDYADNTAPQWRIVRDGRESLIERSDVRTQTALRNRANEYLPESAPPGLAEFQRLAVILFSEGSIKLDRERTAAAREQARLEVPTIQAEVLAGERVVAAHEQIRDRELERLDAYRRHMQRTGALGEGVPRYGQQIGTFILHAMTLSIFGFLLLFYRPAVYDNVRHVLVIALLIVIVCAAAAVIRTTQSPVELVPIAFPVLVVAALWDGRMALNLALVLAAVLSVQEPFLSMSARMVMLLGGSAAALSVRVVRRRSQGLVLGAVVAAVYALTCIALALLGIRDTSELMRCIMWGGVNGVASALIAMGFLPLFEAFTKITTDQTLLELADLNRPLLKRLSLEAPGTYAHSINVANLAEAAAREIDANSLLVRVGAYYHDVGKMATPQYFIENQARGRNPHEQIDPRKSAQIVRAHVTEGMKLAEQAKVPESVRRFIPEHHGTQTIGFFYDQARQANPDAELVARDFAYAGPKPQIRETAILMLADSVESAMKVLQEPTPERIRALVDRIVDAKISQGQLEDAPLTLREISRIKEQFTSVLSGMYHHRIDYPATREVTSTPEPSRTSGSSD
ncbi:MAG TPA: HDIG domain-containing protein [Longimicrobiales bacterium]|nr:HDIG domain-containing protein [Longimicrobiales bacterium]